jgi:hypothetical protein
MPKEILSKDQIKEIAMAMSSDEADLPEHEARLAAASADVQRVVKRAWKLRLEAQRLKELGVYRLVETEKPAKNSTNGK